MTLSRYWRSTLEKRGTATTERSLEAFNEGSRKQKSLVSKLSSKVELMK